MNFNFADPAMIIGACVIVLLIVAAIVSTAVKRSSRKRTEELRARFGPEYDLALREFGSRRKAETTLLDRINRVNQLKIRALTMAENNRYLAEWDSIQSRFVDHPRGAVIEADELINSLLATCGYPAGPFGQRASDLSVHHSRLVEPYRRANAITVRAGKNEATTEELRSAMILYRALFEEFMKATTIATPIDISRPEAA